MARDFEDKRPKEQAKELGKRVRSMMRRNGEDVIYEVRVSGRDDFDSDDPIELRMLRALSAGGARLRTTIEIIGYNVGDPTDLVGLDDAAWLAREYDVDIEGYKQYGSYEPTVAIHADFSY